MPTPSLPRVFGTPRFAQAATIDPANIAATGKSVQTFTVRGLKTDMTPLVRPRTVEFADVRIVNTRVSATNTLEITFDNFNAGARNQASFIIDIICF